jgi:hypothetical protein
MLESERGEDYTAEDILAGSKKSKQRVRYLEIIKDFTDFEFLPGRFNMWSPATKTVYYDSRRLKTNKGKVGLLHEIGHGILGHRVYKYDMELLRMEMEAWDIVRQLAAKYDLEIDEEHIANCISSYDNWLSRRATCPDCNNFSLQKDRSHFACFACGSKWKVNDRKDRRVTRTVVERYEHVHALA